MKLLIPLIAMISLMLKQRLQRRWGCPYFSRTKWMPVGHFEWGNHRNFDNSGWHHTFYLCNILCWSDVWHWWTKRCQNLQFFLFFGRKSPVFLFKFKILHIWKYWPVAVYVFFHIKPLYGWSEVRQWCYEPKHAKNLWFFLNFSAEKVHYFR